MMNTILSFIVFVKIETPAPLMLVDHVLGDPRASTLTYEIVRNYYARVPGCPKLSEIITETI